MTKLQLGYSQLTNSIVLARMKTMPSGALRRQGFRRDDVTNQAAKLVWKLVKDLGGEISWSENGRKMVLVAVEAAHG